MVYGSLTTALRPARVLRTERALHWVHAPRFFVLLGSGLVLYLPRLSDARRPAPLVKDVHF